MLRKVHLPAGWVIAIRLTELNREVLDYVLLPTTRLSSRSLKFSEGGRQRRGIESFPTFDDIAHVAAFGTDGVVDGVETADVDGGEYREYLGIGFLTDGRAHVLGVAVEADADVGIVFL